MQKKVAYFLYNERPDSGLISSQLIPVLRELKCLNSDKSITVIAFWLPWIWLMKRREIKIFRGNLKQIGVRLESYPFALPERHLFNRIFLLNICIPIAQALALPVFRGRYSLIHSRGYFASYIANHANGSRRTKTIFDGRSLYPLEKITQGLWSQEDRIFHKWKRIEKDNLDRSDYSVGVSRPLVNELIRISPKADVRFIPCNVDLDMFTFSMEARAEIRKIMHWEGKTVLVYEGSLGLSFWNDIRVYLDYYEQLKQVHPQLLFVILTQSDQRPLAEEIRKRFDNSGEVTIISVGIRELYKWLSASDIGIQVMDKIPDGFSRLGVKLTEYLACSLPVIVNSNVGGAEDIVLNNNVGVSLNLTNMEEFNQRAQVFFDNYGSLRQNCVNLARSFFSVKVIAGQYNDIYHNLK